MVTTRVSKEYTLSIPEEFRPLLGAGQEVRISADAQGRLVVTPIEQIRARLQETFGMWSNRDDLPDDGVGYVDEIRHGQRLIETERHLSE